MPRDYKNRRTRKKNDSTPGWVWGLAGLGVGLAVALAVHLHDRRMVRPSAPVANQKAVPSSARAEADETDDTESGSKFDFYEMLPDFVVSIPESAPGASGKNKSHTAAATKGTYVLQAGSFRNFADADRMKARLAFLGLESDVVAVTLDDRQWHRVRLGPYRDMTEAQLIRRQIRQADIDVLVLKVAD